MNINQNQVKAINSISRKIALTQTQLAAYYRKLGQGQNENRVLAEMLGAGEDVDPLHYLTSLLTASELTMLKDTLHNMNPNRGNASSSQN